jgi:hypothetical protein
VRQQLLETLINLELTDLSISDLKSAESNRHKLIYDFDKEHQSYLESKFIFWKFLAIVKYSELDLVALAFHAELSQPKASEELETGPGDAGYLVKPKSSLLPLFGARTT